jgi:hypothetical protein
MQDPTLDVGQIQLHAGRGGHVSLRCGSFRQGGREYAAARRSRGQRWSDAMPIGSTVVIPGGLDVARDVRSGSVRVPDTTDDAPAACPGSDTALFWH